MNCNNVELKMIEAVDAPLSHQQQAEIQAHLATCLSCRSTAQQLQRIDAALSRALRAPALSQTFVENLQIRIAAQAPAWSEQERLERKQQLERDFAMAMAKLKGGRLYLASLMNMIGGAVLFGCVAWLVCHFSPLLIARFGLNGLDQALANSVLASAIFVCLGLAAAFSKPLRRALAQLEP